MKDLFPQGVAYGDSFYDRDKERLDLKKAVDNGLHTVLIAPRRYGKTSLMRKVVSDNDYPYIWIDFMTFVSREEAEKVILAQLAKLVTQIGGTEEKIKSLAKKFLTFLQPEITVNLHSVVTINFKHEAGQQDNLIHALIAIDEIARHTNKRAVIVFDEFQEIINIDEHSAFQGSIRHAVELARGVTYLFSGSRHITLRNLFTGKKSPLYELCDLMILHRVTAEYYESYIQEKAVEKWDHAIDHKIIAKVLEYSECYPKYVNALCRKIWTSDLEPTLELVDTIWEDFVFSRKDDIYMQLENLKINERKLLKLMCKTPTDKPFSMQYASMADLSPTSLRRSLEDGLLKKELVMRDTGTGEYYVVDPVLKYYLNSI